MILRATWAREASLLDSVGSLASRFLDSRSGASGGRSGAHSGAGSVSHLSGSGSGSNRRGGDRSDDFGLLAASGQGEDSNQGSQNERFVHLYVLKVGGMGFIEL